MGAIKIENNSSFKRLNENSSPTRKIHQSVSPDYVDSDHQHLANSDSESYQQTKSHASLAKIKQEQNHSSKQNSVPTQKNMNSIHI